MANPSKLSLLSRDTACVLLIDHQKHNVVALYVTYPHWMDAQRKSAHADLLNAFHAAD